MLAYAWDEESGYFGYAVQGQEGVHILRTEAGENYNKGVEEELLAISADFVRIHKAYLVNMEHVEAFQYEKLALRDGTFLSISEAHRAYVRSRFWEWGSE